MTWFSTTKNLLSKVKSSVEKSKATTATTKELQVTEIERKSERRSRKGSDRTLDLDDDEDYYGSDDPRMYNNNHEGTTTTNYGDQDYEDDFENGGSGSGSGNGGRLKYNPNCPPISLLPSKSKYEIAIFGCGEFWNPQRVFQKLYGVKHVVVGYTGGYSTYPSFDNPQDHTYALYIEYNPKKISYTTLLHVWHLHDYPWEQDDQDDNNELNNNNNNNNNSHLHTQSAIYCITSKQYQLAYEFKFNVLLPKAIQRRRRSKNQQATRRKQFQQLQHRYEYGDDVLCCRKQKQQLLQQQQQQYHQQQQQCCYPTVIVDGYGAAQIHFGDNGNDTTSASSSGNPPNPITVTSTTSDNNNNNNNIELLYVHIGYVTIFYQAELYQQNYISKQIQQAKQQLKLWMDNEVNSSLYTIYE